MGLFEYIFGQFSYKSIQMTIFQVSLRLVEGLQRKSWKKVTRNGQIVIINRIYHPNKIVHIYIIHSEALWTYYVILTSIIFFYNIREKVLKSLFSPYQIITFFLRARMTEPILYGNFTVKLTEAKTSIMYMKN